MFLIIIELFKKPFCQIVIVPRDFTNKFQPLDVTVKKSAKSFISNKYKAWFSEQVSKPTNCLSVFDHFVGLALQGLS